MIATVMVEVWILPPDSVSGTRCTRYKFKGKSAIFSGFMLTRAVPGIALSLPLFMIFARTGIIDTHFALILTYVALNVPFTIWLIDGFFRQVPKDLAEAAQIDAARAGRRSGRWSFRWPVPASHPLASSPSSSPGTNMRWHRRSPAR